MIFEIVRSENPTPCRSYSVVGVEDDNVICFIAGGYRQIAKERTLLCKPATMYLVEAKKIVASLNNQVESGYASIDFLDSFARTRFN